MRKQKLKSILHKLAYEIQTQTENEIIYNKIDNETGIIHIIKVIDKSYFCQYIGINENHPLAGIQYYCFPFEVDCHGGLTFSGNGKDFYQKLPPGYWYYGWDYAHFGDYTKLNPSGKKWTLLEVLEEGKKVLKQFKKYYRINFCDTCLKILKRLK